MPVKGMTQSEIDAATRAQVASGAVSTDRANRLPGETASEANARITAAYKEMTAKPIISQEQKDAGLQVKFVRTGAGGVGEHMVITPIGYTGPAVEVTKFTSGVIPANVTKTTGASVGVNAGVTETAGATKTTASASGTALSNLKEAEAAAAQPAKVSVSAAESAAAARATAGTKKYTAAELQAIVAKLGRGQTLTAEEAAAVGVSDQNSITPTSTAGSTPDVTGKSADQIEADRLAKIAEETVAKNKKVQDAYGKFQRKEKLTAEEKALLGLAADYEYSGSAKGVDGAAGTADTAGALGEQPGTGWVLSADGKSWVKPPMPSDGKQYTWDNNKGWVAGTDENVISEKPIGTPPAFVWDPVSKTWKMPVKPTAAGNWVWDNISGWVDTTVVPGATGMETGSEKTLALDTFKNTLALFFGAKEASQSWVNGLFNIVSGYYKTGSTIDEALNLSLQDARNKPELAAFTKRFAGVFALQDRLAAGEAVSVPTIAEFFKSEAMLGDKLREVGLGDIATQEILGDVLGTGKSVAAVLSLVDNVFMAIDNAPEQLKKDLQVVAPGIDRTSIAKALLLGKKGADELQKKIKEVSVFSAAKSQGIAIGDAISADYAARGFDYAQSLEGFGTVAKGSPTLQKLTEISSKTKSTSEEAQKTLMKSIFERDVKAQEQLRMEAEKEVGRFSGSSGTLGSRSLASRNRANRAI